MRGTEPGTKGAESFTIGGEVWTISYHHDRPREPFVVEKNVVAVEGERSKTTIIEQYALAQRGGTTTVCATMKSSPEHADLEIVMRYAAKVRCRSTEPYQPGVGRMLGLAEVFTAIAMRNGVPYIDEHFVASWTQYFTRHPADVRLSRYAHEIDARVPDMAPAVTRVTAIDFDAATRTALRAGRAARRAAKREQRKQMKEQAAE